MAYIADDGRYRLGTREKPGRVVSYRVYRQQLLREREEAKKAAARSEASKKAAATRAARRQLQKDLSLRAQVVQVGEVIETITSDPALAEGVEAFRGRMNQTAGTLAGIWNHLPSRSYFQQELDKMWELKGKRFLSGEGFGSSYIEVVVGGGAHAAIYCSVRNKLKGTRTLVLESGSPGGIFSVSRNPSFYMNSRNRPGPLSIPGAGDGLNVLPEAPVQMEDLSAAEFQTNDEMAFVVRAALAFNAEVASGVKVSRTTLLNDGRVELTLDSGKVIYADRVVLATGLTKPTPLLDRKSSVNIEFGGPVLSFNDFMARMDTRFPLQGLGRVAVVGAGDSGKAVIEALTGIGPVAHWSVPALDYIEVIDWYGVPESQRTCNTWIAANRSRYKAIGKLLPDNGAGFYRVNPFGNVVNATTGYNVVYLDGRPYDTVVVCLGFNQYSTGGNFPDDVVRVQGRPVARFYRIGSSGAKGLYGVGPIIRLGKSDYESLGPGDLPENLTSLFRYADRTATFAAQPK